MVFVSKPNQITCTASQHTTLQPSCIQRQHGLISKTTFSILVINVMSSFSTFYKHVLFSNSFNRTHDNYHQLSTKRWESLQIFASSVIHQAAGEMWTLTKYINKKWTSRSVLNVSRNTSRHSAWRRNCVDVETFCWKSGSICWKNRCSRPAVGVYITQNALSTTFLKIWVYVAFKTGRAALMLKLSQFRLQCILVRWAFLPRLFNSQRCFHLFHSSLWLNNRLNN